MPFPEAIPRSAEVNPETTAVQRGSIHSHGRAGWLDGPGDLGEPARRQQSAPRRGSRLTPRAGLWYHRALRASASSKPPRCAENDLWRGAGVVERGGLENRCTRERTVGSNPTLSAKHGNGAFVAPFSCLMTLDSNPRNRYDGATAKPWRGSEPIPPSSPIKAGTSAIREGFGGGHRPVQPLSVSVRAIPEEEPVIVPNAADSRARERPRH